MTTDENTPRSVRWPGQLFRAVVVGLSAAVLSVTVALALDWLAPAKLDQSESVRRWDTIDLSLDSDVLYIGWAKGEAGAGIQVAVRELTAGAWATPLAMAAPSPAQYAWSPSLAHNATDLGVAWTQGTSTACDVPHSIMQQDVSDAAAATIIGNVYGAGVAPDLAAGSSGWHLVFAGTALSERCGSGSKFDLYYSHRATSTQPWATPVVIAAHNAVLDPTALAGGIWYPRIAMDATGTVLYVVWEQYQLLPTLPAPTSESSIWMITGTVAAPSAVWSAPVRLSPTSQQYAVRPGIGVDADAQPHVVWTRFGGTSDQSIYYLRRQGGPATPLNSEPIHVSDNAPKYARSSIAAQGDAICVTWHGYTSAGPEDIALRCSENGGAAWQIVETVSSSLEPLSVYPEIALTDDSIAHTAWAEYVVVDDAWVPQGVFYRSGTPPDDGRVFLPLVTKGR